MKAQDYLPDDQNHGNISGITVRKGTVGAFLVNARVWLESAATAESRAAAEADIREALPGLTALGLFEVLTIRDERLRQFVAAHL